MVLFDCADETFGKNHNNKGYKQSNTNFRKKSKWFSDDCYNAKKEFKSARNIYNRDKTDTSRINFVRSRTKYNKIKKKAKQNFRLAEGKRINSMAKKQPRQFWKNVKSKLKNKQCYADTLKIDDLFNHFKDLFGETQVDHNAEEIPEIIIDNEIDQNFTEMELRSAVFSQKNNKSPGTDNLLSEVFKTAYDVIAPFLLTLYNRLFSSGEYPRTWGEGIITPIFKKGNPNDAKNYRGITLINILAKIYSQLLLNRLTKWSDKHDKIPNQFGFQKGKSILAKYSEI